jgi:hypothetical protein
VSTPEMLAIEICRVKNLGLSNREYLILVEYLSEEIKERYREIMMKNPEEILQLLDLDQVAARNRHT